MTGAASLATGRDEVACRGGPAPRSITGEPPMNTPRFALTALAAVMVFGVPAPARASAPPGADTRPAPLPVARPGEATATFAGGCFWCMETAFEGVPGVRSATSGYCGGARPPPTHEEGGAGHTRHAESVQVIFDPRIISLSPVLQPYRHNNDPVSAESPV